MKIQSLQINSNNRQTSFKKGLTSCEINQVKNMKTFEYADIARNLKNKFGLEATFAGCNAVAWCVNELVKIMTRAGFKLPGKFSFDYFTNSDALGKYVPTTYTVHINSKYTEFTDLEKQNKLEESQGSFHPKTKHFLQTYLHEFSHAAHFQNLCNKFGFSKSYEIMMGYLNTHTPKEILVEPIRIAFGKSITDSIISPTDGEYAEKSLNEYFAEKNSRRLAEQLGPRYCIQNIENDFAHTYFGHISLDTYKKYANIPAMRSALDMMMLNNMNMMMLNDMSSLSNTSFMNPIGDTIDTIKWIKNQIKLVDGDIFNGNIESLKGSYFTK